MAGKERPCLGQFLRSSKDANLTDLFPGVREDIRNKFIDLEWQQRDRLAQGVNQSKEPSQWARLSGDSILQRNRYINIDPYVINRVHLKVPQGRNDYINASHISLKSSRDGKEKRYIATQGPSEYSLHHMWRMVWHETSDVAVIVMLTQTHEAGREKCFQYFPADENSRVIEINGHDEYQDGFKGTIQLLETRFDSSSRSDIRKLKLSIGSESKIVWHFLFNGWPDFLIPEGEDRMALVELIKQTEAQNPDPTNPLIVHCSAGVGRSGTFIALDHLLRELNDGTLANVSDGADPILETVDSLRKQRMMMVQGEAQFFFLYDFLEEQWQQHYSARPSNH